MQVIKHLIIKHLSFFTVHLACASKVKCTLAIDVLSTETVTLLYLYILQLQLTRKPRFLTDFEKKKIL